MAVLIHMVKHLQITNGNLTMQKKKKLRDNDNQEGTILAQNIT